MTTESHADLSAEALRWAAQAVGGRARVENVRRMAGSTSSTLFALDIRLGSDVLECVLRRYDNAEWRAGEPHAPQREAAALRRVSGSEIAAPALLACDPNGTASGGVPLVLMGRLPGRVVLVPDDLDRWLYGLADALLPVHSIPADDFPWRYGTYVDVPSLTPPAWSRVPYLWERVISIAQGPAPPAPACLIHRDYHPTNVLWEGDKVSGIVDWPNACRGAANFDVAWCRLNLLYLYGVAAADRFLAAYESLAGRSFTHHPYWDTLALVEVLPGPPRLYPPWAEFGVHDLTADLMRQRQDGYPESILRRS